MINFKTFLLMEGGAATAKYNVQRATKQDIVKAIELVSKALGIDKQTIQASLLGSTEVTLAGKKKDSGDIDIAMSTEQIDPDEADKRMLALCNNEGSMNKGTKIGSYAVDVGGKKVQVDLMFVQDKQWAKFIYHSAQGVGSKYPGAVRNIMLMAAVRYKQEAGKDLIVKDGDKVIARASRALKLDVGLERLFKMAGKSKRTGEWSRTASNKVSPTHLQKEVNKLVGKPVQFSHDAEIISDPDQVASFIFGKGTKASDLMTAEQVAAKIKKLPNAAEVIKAAKEDLANSNLPIPTEL
jgi:hypothetical protein